MGSLTLRPGATRNVEIGSNLLQIEILDTLNLKLELMDSGYPRYRAAGSQA